MGTGRAITLLLLVGLAEASVAQLPDRLGFALKGFSFAEHGLSAPKDLLVDDHGYAWVLGEQGTYCLVGGRPVQVHDLAAHADVIAWAPPEAGHLRVRTGGGIVRLPLAGPAHDTAQFILSVPGMHEARLPDGRHVRLEEPARLVITGQGDTIVRSLAFDRHMRLFGLEVGSESRMIFDPRNGIWVLGRNGLMLASHLDPVFRITELPDQPGQPTQFHAVPGTGLMAVLTRRELLFVDTLTGRPEHVIRHDQQGNPVGGMRLVNWQGRHFIHQGTVLQEVDFVQRTVRTVLDLRTLLPPGTAVPRINDITAGPGSPYIHIGTVDNLYVVFDPHTGATRCHHLMDRDQFSGINLVYEPVIVGENRVLVLAEHNIYLVDGMGELRLARDDWPNFRFNSLYKLSGVEAVGDTLLAMVSFANGMLLYNIATDSLYRPTGWDVEYQRLNDIFQDGQGHLLATAREGLLVYTIADNSSRMVRIEHGLPIEDCWYRFMSILEPGRMAFGLVEHYTTFRTRDLLHTPEHPYVEGVMVDGRPAPFMPYLPAGGAIELPPSSANITFYMGSPLHMAPPFTGAYVQLHGLPGGRRFVDTREAIDFHGLGPGEHVVEAAAQPDGPYVTVFHVNVSPPVWRRWWFLAGIALLLVAVTGLLVGWAGRMRRGRELLRAEFNARITDLELQALRARMHPHFIFNSLNSIKSHVAANDTVGANRYIDKFAHLLRAILDRTGRSDVTLTEEIDALRLFVEIEGMRFDDSFTVQIDVAPAIPADQVLVPPMVVQPHVENAIWHGLLPKDGDRHLRVAVAREDETLVIVVSDNGVGRVAAAERARRSHTSHRSMGTVITQEVVARSGGTVDVVDLYHPDGTPAGTEVHIRLPFHLG
ncbi:MAG: histidine kinase [Flavobacteriales bacterium]|jgi:hypothetical protein|nr:histidine kinase [Flavobacteriales bacterium]